MIQRQHINVADKQWQSL